MAIPGYVTIEDPSVLFNIYEPKWPYPMPGPVVYVPSTGTVSGEQKVGVANKKIEQKDGMVPHDAVVQNANWWAVELDAYDDEDGCWNVSSWFSELLGG